MLRGSRRHPEQPLEPAEVAQLPGGNPFTRVDARRELERALVKLTDDQREVIELHWFAGLSFPEVAELVGASVSAVKVRAHRGYETLRRLLEDQGADSGGKR